LLSFGVGKTQILRKTVFQKIKNGRDEKICLSYHLGFFQKLFFLKICVLSTPNECKKKIEKTLDSQSYVKKSDFDPPFWTESPFLTHLTIYALENVADKNTNVL
jgi:hypothetical protein